MTCALKVVLVGYGPVGARFVEELLPAVRAATIDLTVVGAEAVDTYNRVLLADYATARIDRDALSITDTEAAIDAGVRFHLGARVVGIDRKNRIVTLVGVVTEPGVTEPGVTESYDRLVLATGARANIPTLNGIDRPAHDRAALVRAGSAAMAADAALPNGVVALRDLADAVKVRSAVRAHQRIVVLGAGVLGLEIAFAAALVGADIQVVHHGGYPMARNLDRAGGTVLAKTLRQAGVTVLAHSRAERVEYRTGEHGTAQFDALLCADGKRVPGDLLLLSCGVTPRIELAVLARLPVSRGILVDAELRSWSDANIRAIGDCAHISQTHTSATHTGETHVSETPDAPVGGPSGLIGPGWAQAQWLASSILAEVGGAARPARLAAERAPVVMMKADDVDVVSAGLVDAEPWDDDESVAVSQWMDPEHGQYVKMVTRAGVLEGIVCVGMPRTGAELTLMFERGSELPAERSTVLDFDGPDTVPTHAADGFDADATVCWCNGVTAGRIRESAAAGSCTVTDIGADTRAGRGCGGCAGRITELLAQFATAPIGR